MPVQQISVGPGRETASNGKGAPRSKDKNEGGKSSGRSGSRSSSVSKVSSSGAGAAPRTSGSPPSQDICSSGQLTRVEEGASDTNKKTSKHTRAGTMTVNVAAQTQKKQVKRRHRRKRDSCTALDCADTVTKLDPADRSPSSDRSDRGEKQERAPKARRELPARLRSSAPLESDSSSDEEGWREARSWSKEKARRGRRRSRSSRERDGERVSGVNGGGGDKVETMELQSVDSNEGKESRAMLEDGGGLKKRRGGGGSSERERGSQKGDSQGRERRKQHGSLKSRSPAGSSSLPEEGEELITKRYQEKGMGGGDMSVPSPEKCSAVNGGMAQPCSEDSELEVCRICHCEGEEECPLITPCRCTGSLRFVHQACLNQWIKSSDTRCCELCKYDFIMETQLKPLRMWEKLQMTKSERRKIFCSVLFHLIAVACVLWSVYVLVRRTAEEIRFGRNGILEWPFWTKLTVVAIGFTGGVIFMYIQCKVYLQLWCRLKAFNRIITVQNCPEKGQPSSQAPSATLANGKHQRAAVPINSVPVPVTVPVWEVQTDSDMSVEAAVAPAQSPV